MRRIIVSNLLAQYNFGSPCILHGFNELLKEIYGENNYTLQYIQTSGEIIPETVADMEFPCDSIEIRVKRVLVDLLKGKLGWKVEQGKYNRILDILSDADLVVDLFGICFCDNLEANKNGMKGICKSISKYFVAFIAKMLGIKTVKNTASYGPINSDFNKLGARFAAQCIFDEMIAREVKSREAMKSVDIRKEIQISPDVANLMNFKPVCYDRDTIGISVSHQMVRQWKNAEDYIVCIANLCRHISKTLSADILLIPNENVPENPYNDIDVAEDIVHLLKDSGASVEILDALHMTSTEQKNAIAGCKAVIASRYHSCVASLSAGVPTFVIGWHYKYEELLQLYGQEKWHLSGEECTSDKLISMFDEFWRQQDVVREEIGAHYSVVRSAIIEVGKQVLI